MNDAQRKQLLAEVFVKGYENFSGEGNLNRLSEKISNEIDGTPINGRTLRNFYNYYFLDKGEKQNPSTATEEILLKYIGKSRQKFVQGITGSYDYINNVPFLKDKLKEIEDAKVGTEHSEDENKGEGYVNEQQFTAVHTYRSENTNSQINFNQDDKRVNVQSNPQISVTNVINNSNTWIFITLSLMVLAVVILYTTKRTTQLPVTVNVLNVSDQIYPKPSTNFFDEDGVALVWYTNYQGKTEYYNKQGRHPASRELLKPVTPEYVTTHFVSRAIQNEQIEEPRSTVTYEKDKPKKKKENTVYSILNEGIVNKPKVKELSIFVFDSVPAVDAMITNHLKQELGKTYTITAPIITEQHLTRDVIANLVSSNISALGNVKKHIDYLCTGTVSYTFSDNTILKGKKNCNMSISYTIVSTTTGEMVDSYSNTITGYGTTRSSAKINTIKKLTL